ncbi:MAG: FKBP-type peptidyl-prolyl cis-trans isomerase [Bacteroidetes bacterium]|nr:FKBP-type peptidyl-prolyl cis-trans isomerase [Bacteroidota bacterium]
MKRLILLTTLALLAGVTVFSQGKKDKKKEKEAPAFALKTKADTISYIIGSDIGKNIKTTKMDFSEEAFKTGLMNGYNGKDSLFTREQVEAIMKNFQAEMEARQNADKDVKSKANKEKGAAFMAENKKKEGVIQLPAGLQFRILKDGVGPTPRETDTVTVYYKGTLIDGTVFDATTPGEPVSFPLGNLIKGWTEGIQLMKVGSKYEFVIPPDLGYGDREVGPIPPSSTLIFEVELIAIKPGNN